jgi:hypothetical protein
MHMKMNSILIGKFEQYQKSWNGKMKSNQSDMLHRYSKQPNQAASQKNEIKQFKVETISIIDQQPIDANKVK